MDLVITTDPDLRPGDMVTIIDSMYVVTEIVNGYVTVRPARWRDRLALAVERFRVRLLVWLHRVLDALEGL